MVRDTDKKRKLEQANGDSVTPKRLKPTKDDSTKKATPKTNGAAESPMVLVSRSEHLKQNDDTPKASKSEKKKAKRDSDVQSTPQATPGAQLRAESDDVVTPVDQKKSLEKELANCREEANQKERGAQQSMSKKSRKDKKKRKLRSNDAAIVQSTEGGDGAAVQAPDEEALRKAEKKAKRKERRHGAMVLQEDGIATPSTQNGWTLSGPSAGRYIDHDSIFVADENGASCLIAATAREIQLLSLDTSLVVRSHTVPEGRRIVAFSRSPANEESVDVAYDNGAKVQWNWITSSLTNGTFPGQERVIAMTSAIMVDGKTELFYITEDEHANFSVVGERKVLTTTTRRLNNIRVLHEGAYIVCSSGGGVVIGARKNPEPQSEYTWIDQTINSTLRCANARLVVKQPSKKEQHKRADLMLALGCEDGKILLYSSLAPMFGSKAPARLPEPRVLHWHREKVSDVKFSMNGEYLISGGRETTLVQWVLETGKPNFLPHLTAEIEHIVVSPEGNQYALHMGDNSIMVLSTSELHPVANFAGLQHPIITEQLAAEYAPTPRTAVVLHPHDQHKLLLTVPATQPKSIEDVSTRPFLQTFDLRNSRHLSRQALTRNNVTDFNLGPDNTPIIPPDVLLVAISQDGQFMATVDEWEMPATDLDHLMHKTKELGPEDIPRLREEQQKRREVYLKFWRWNAPQGLWTLSTRADGPHAIATDTDLKLGAGSILKLVADPSSNRFATVGQDSVVKIWTPRTRLRGGVPIKEADGIEAVDWVCKRTVSVPVSTHAPGDAAGNPRQDSPMEDESGKPLYIEDASLAFSPDGSLLACASVAESEMTFPIIHFIEVDTGLFKAHKPGLVAPDQEVIDVGFVDKYFVSLSVNAVRVWDLINDAHHHTIALPRGNNNMPLQHEALLAVNHMDETFALVSYDIDDDDEPTPRMRVYSPRKNEPLFDTTMTTFPAALLAPQNASGFTVLFEDATIRTLSSTAISSSTALVPATDDAPTKTTLALPSAETTAALAQREEDIEMDDTAAFVFSSGEIIASRAAIEDDKPVVRPEQLNAILGVGQPFAMPALTQMFQSMASLHSRAPRRKQKAEVA